MLKRIGRFFFLSGIIVLCVLLTVMNIRVHHSHDFRDGVNHDVVKELRGLKRAMHSNADKEMQQIFPEGYVFLNALYGLAWCNFTNSNSEFFNEGHMEVQDAWDKIDSNSARATFDEDLLLNYGAFYTGWSTYLLGKKLSIEENAKRNATELALFKHQCERIDTALKKQTYPQSYRGSAWPADVVVCVAALALHDKLFPEKHSAAIKSWIEKIKTKLDPLQLIPHAVHSRKGNPTENARGSSQSLMLIFLKEIDNEFANDQFKIYKANFLDDRFGLTGIREFPKKTYGIGDVDSGPVVLQMGSAATIVGMQTMYVFGEEETAVKIRSTIESIGFPLENNERKVYLFGTLPMADAFITWGHSSMKQIHFYPNFMLFHIYSAISLLILFVTAWLLMKSFRK